jgi:hypothetical protein
MNTAQVAKVAAEIEDVVRAIPGVADLYRPGSPFSNVLDAGTRGLGLRDDAAPLVRVHRGDGEDRVEIAMGIHSAAGAAVTTQAVYQAVRDLLVDREQPGARVVLTVVHVHEPPLQGASPI